MWLERETYRDGGNETEGRGVERKTGRESEREERW